MPDRTYADVMRIMVRESATLVLNEATPEELYEHLLAYRDLAAVPGVPATTLSMRDAVYGQSPEEHIINMAGIVGRIIRYAADECGMEPVDLWRGYLAHTSRLSARGEI